MYLFRVRISITPGAQYRQQRQSLVRRHHGFLALAVLSRLCNQLQTSPNRRLLALLAITKVREMGS